jgi:ankyrin repeat protein
MAPKVLYDAGSIFYPVHANDIGSLKRHVIHNPQSIHYATEVHGYTALREAIDSGNIEAIRILLHAGASLDMKDDYGWSSGEQAAKMIISRRYNPEVRDEVARIVSVSQHIEDMGILPIHLVAAGYCVGDFKSLVPDDSSGGINVTDFSGRTPLYWAMDSSNALACEELLCLGADLDAHNPSLTPMICSTIRNTNSTEIFDLLIEHGANLSALDGGLHPLHFAGWHNRLEAVKKLIASGADPTVQVTKDAGEAEQGGTPIHAAAQFENYEVMEYLLNASAGKGIDIQNGQGYTALTEATIVNSYRCLDILLERGAAVQIGSSKNALLEAAEFGDIQTLKRLAEHVHRHGCSGDTLQSGGFISELDKRFLLREAHSREIEVAYQSLRENFAARVGIVGQFGFISERDFTDTFFDALEYQ